MTTGFVYDERFLDHDAGPHHPERPERLERTIDHLRGEAWFGRLRPLPATPCDRVWLESVHSGELVDRAREACHQGQSFLDVADVGICRDSYDIARLAAGAALGLADAVAEGEIDNGFALCRPPGHHAEHNVALGFCLFNNVAIAARYLKRRHGVDKILILDWDVHHGNGTQHTFESDPSVLFVSTHQYPYYPGTGAVSEDGEGRGRGATLNCPMPAGAGDREYERAFTERILPKIEAFAPEVVIVSAGFDAHAADPLAHIMLSTEFFAWMTERVLEVADQHAGGRLVSLLEGGYNTDVLPLCVATHLELLSRGS